MYAIYKPKTFGDVKVGDRIFIVDRRERGLPNIEAQKVTVVDDCRNPDDVGIETETGGEMSAISWEISKTDSFKYISEFKTMTFSDPTEVRAWLLRTFPGYNFYYLQQYDEVLDVPLI
jgi:hypothetical protein